MEKCVKSGHGRRFVGGSIKNFDPTRVKVVTEYGTVFLMGLVTRAEGAKAADITRHIEGVKRVVKLFEYTDAKPT